MLFLVLLLAGPFFVLADCPAGSSCDPLTGTATPCPSPKYAPFNSYYCLSPPPDKTTVEECPSSTPYSNLIEGEACQACPAGYECAKGGSLKQCGPGYYSTAGMGSCAQCPANSICPDKVTPLSCQGKGPQSTDNFCTSEYSVSCPAGQYISSGKCTACSEGKYCPGDTVPPLDCPSGFFSSSPGASECAPCPAGKSCESKAAAADCAVGTYSLRGLGKCLACPAGFTCAVTSALPEVCAYGKYILDGVCTACPAGSFCETPEASPVACEAGYYSEGSATACTPCPGGRACSSTGVGTVCSSGTFLLPLQYGGSCTSCSAGSECPSPKAPALACLAGTYSGANDVQCNLCENSYQCPDTTASSRKVCDAGYFCPMLTVSQKACPDGFNCSFSGIYAPSRCPEGKYSLSTTLCASCPPGSACPTGHLSTLYTCPNGTYSIGGTTVCSAPPEGTYLIGNTVTALVKCTLGQYIVPGSGSDQCKDCPPGSYCPDQHEIHACPEGTYSGSGATKCTVCPAGSACSNTGVAECPKGSYALPGATVCTQCREGYYCPVNTVPLVKECDVGYYAPSPGMSACIKCPQNYACKDKKTAIACPSHYYSLSGWGECQPCPAGYRCSPDEGPILCSPGYYSQEGNKDCIICPAGNYCPQGSSRPHSCPIGKYASGEGNTACLACSPGSYTHNIGSTACLLALPGYYAPTTTGPPSQCPIGTYSQGNCTSCSPCTPGYLCTSGAHEPAPANDLCPLGCFCFYQASAEISTGMLVIQPCPGGKYGTAKGTATETAGCSTCPQGFYCPLNGTVVPTPCPKGGYCPGGTASPSKCGGGTYNPVVGSSSVSACLTCPIGSYCPEGATEPIGCPPGYYCAAGSDTYLRTICEAGTYSSIGQIPDKSGCVDCPAGSFCVAGTIAPKMCPPGTYNPTARAASQSSCLNCTSGKACIRHGNTADSGVPCPPGFYCPVGTQYPTQFPCPSGTYSDLYDATSISACLTCPQGWVCDSGTNKFSNPMKRCKPGHYCESGTSVPSPCPAGKYQPFYGGESLAACMYVCPPGKYCPAGSANPAGNCGPGYFCPEGSGNATANPCPPGTYSTGSGLQSVNECTLCPVGYYCPIASTSATIFACPAGTYNSRSGASSAADCLDCVGGYACPGPGASSMIACGYGRCSDVKAKECRICPETYYCNGTATAYAAIVSGSVACEAGYVCPEGVGEYPSQALLCPAGYYCGLRTVDPTPCPPGTYNPHRGAKTSASCLPTPAGKYSKRGSTSPTGYCAPGFYCPLESRRSKMIPCEIGTFRSVRGGSSRGDCGICPAGYFCTVGCAKPRPCPIGSYCEAGTKLPTKCPAGYFGASPMLRKKEQCTKCWSGRYCSVQGLSSPDGNCDPGYYCIGGATVPAPMDGVTGNLCPPGGVCPVGSKFPQPCLPGTFSDVGGMKEKSQCGPCKNGSFCIGEVKNGVSGPCLPGYFCPSGTILGSKSAKEFAAAPGHYTGSGASSQVPCPAGTYAANPASSGCLPCPAGYFCADEGNAGNFTKCSAGGYCPTGSSSVTPCPPGSYSPILNLQRASDCTPCPPGKFCLGGSNIPSGNCSAGYYCLLGANTSQPANYTCPKGSYCPSGSGIPTPCPASTYNPIPRATNLDQCLACPPGNFCGRSGLSVPEGLCDIGYYCNGSDTSPRPAGKRCKIGQKCPRGSALPTDCPAGSYQDSVAQGECMKCPRGFFCPTGSSGFDSGHDCPPGHYCPEGTGSEYEKLCPAGTYNPNKNAFALAQCVECDPGKYCSGVGRIAVGPDCDAGYYCVRGSTSATPASARCSAGYYCPSGTSYPVPCPPGKACESPGMSTDGVFCEAGYFCTLAATKANPLNSTQGGGPCIPGFYCPSGSRTMFPCPPGTYSNEQRNVGRGACIACDDGYYCETSAATKKTGKCDAGYYCKKAADATVGYVSSRPLSQVCPKGYYCPAGALDKIPCADTEYQDRQGQAKCNPCPPGYWCEAVAKHLCTPNIGKASYYCPGGTRAYILCEDGHYNVQLGSKSSADCLSCPLGKYCPRNPNATEGKMNGCPAGRYCQQGSGDNRGTICAVGYYCPGEIAEPMQCPPGRYCEAQGLSDIDLKTRPCSAGYFCKLGATTSQPVDGITGTQCPPGNYCPAGTKEPIACPPGTYRSEAGGKSLSDCAACIASQYCQSRGQSAQGSDCPAGYYCPTGTAQGRKFPCEAGYMCPPGSWAPALCPNGSYQPLPVQSACKPCPARFYCWNRNQSDALSPRVCPSGKYCPLTSQPIECPAGKFSSMQGLMSESECDMCPPGKMCVTPGLISSLFALPCAAGYFCSRGVKTNPPPGDSTGGPCPSGHYCPLGTASPIPCPPGKINDKVGSESAKDCMDCPATRYCPYRGGTSTLYQTDAFKCAAGYLCLSGSTIPTPNDGTKGRKCGIGKFCGVGALIESDCPIYTYNPYLGQATCTSCPPGRYCPTPGLSTYIDCPTGYYCPGGTDKLPCPAGTYSPNTRLDSATQCFPCDPGKYCTGGKNRTDGECAAGYVCPRGSKSGISTARQEGLCPPGYYCLAGSKAPTPCEVGKYQDEYGKTSCKTCPMGRYCDVTGLTFPTDKLCRPGFYCTGGATSNSPRSSAEGGHLCTPGHYCPAGTLAELPCPDGSYEPRPGSTQCQTCPVGFYCANGTGPTSCPERKYCPLGTTVPLTCPPGTYSKALGLQNAGQCRLCPSGMYCVDGMLKGPCVAGFYCDAGATSPNDSTKICPPGFYCILGARAPTICPLGKFRFSPGGVSAADCSTCVAGFYCIATVSTPFQCPKGHYCPAGSQSPTPCEKGFYLNSTKSTQQSDCILCPPGYTCSEPGIADLDAYKCRVGYYCPNATRPALPCPNGTFANSPGLAELSGCMSCLEGFYCGVATVTPTLCNEGTYCPLGSVEPITCPPGYYCKYTVHNGTTISMRHDCSGGYYCPEKSVYPVKCENGYYCPKLSAAPIPCPSGTMGANNEYNDAVTTACVGCTSGFFSVRLPNQPTVCRPCTPGYVCLSNTSSATPTDPIKDGGYECPKGFVCPEGAFAPTPCPKGHFNNQKLASSLAQCVPCEEDMFGDLPGQFGCRPCGPTSTSGRGASTCDCVGRHRVFQKSEGKCVCRQYFTSVLEGDQDDSEFDCRPILMERCAEGYLRDTFGKCVVQGSCAAECKGREGKRTPGIGICECEAVQDVDQVCNSDCRKRAERMHVDTSGRIKLGNGETLDMSRASGSGVVGEPDACHKLGGCKVVSVAMASDGGFTANYGPSSKLLALSTNRRRLLGNTTILAGISSPALCINSGDTVAFDVRPSSYPVYMKDAMANSNPSFDHSAFTELATRLAQNESITVFLHTFQQSGVHVFADSADLSQLMLIAVMGLTEKCPDEGKYIVPITGANLIRLGIRQNEGEITLEPNWTAICACFLVMLVVLPGVLACIVKFNGRSSTKTLAPIAFDKKDRKRQTAVVVPLPTEEVPMLSRGKVIDVNSSEEEPEGEGEINPKVLEEIYNQLREHVAYVRTEMEKKSGQDRAQLERVWDQLKSLKHLMRERLKSLAKIFGKNIHRIFKGGEKEKPVGKASPQTPLVAEEEEAVGDGLVQDAQEFGRIEEEQQARNKDFMDKFTDMRDKMLEDFRLRVLKGSKLNAGDKQMLMKEYEAQLLRLQKMLMLEQAETQTHLKVRLDLRRAKREALIREKEQLQNQKAEIKRRENSLLQQLVSRQAQEERQIDGEADARILAEENKLENRRLEDMEKLREKFDRLLKRTEDAKERTRVLEELEKATKALERIYDEERAGQFAEMKGKLEKERQTRKQKLRDDCKEEADSVRKVSKAQVAEIEVGERIIFNKLLSARIDEKLAEARQKARTTDQSQESSRLEALRLKRAEEIEACDSESKTSKVIEDLNLRRNKLMEELASHPEDGKKEELLKQLALVETKIKTVLEEERRVGELRIEERYSREAVRIAQEFRNERFARALAELKQQLSDEELPIAVEKLLDDKHMEELCELLSLHYRTKARLMIERMGQVIEANLMEMHEVKEKAEKEYVRIKKERDVKTISEAEYGRKIREIQEREQDQLRSIELAYIQKGNDLEQELCQEVIGKNHAELIKLREAQLTEKNACISELSKTNHYARGLLSAIPISQDVAEYAKQLEEESAKKLAVLQARRQRLSDIALDNEARVKQFNEETQRLLDEFNVREREKIEHKRQEIEEKKREFERGIREISPDARDEFMKEFQEELAALTRAMENEQKRQGDATLRKLEERWVAKEKLKKQREFQLAVYKKEQGESLDSRIRDMEVRAEADDPEKRVADIIRKADCGKRIFYKKRLVLEGWKDEGESRVEIDWDEMLKAVVGMQSKISGFAEGSFTGVAEGFRMLRTKLEELRAKALSDKAN